MTHDEPPPPSPASRSVTMDREHMLDELEAVILDTHDLDVTARAARSVVAYLLTASTTPDDQATNAA